MGGLAFGASSRKCDEPRDDAEKWVRLPVERGGHDRDQQVRREHPPKPVQYTKGAPDKEKRNAGEGGQAKQQ